MTEKGTGIEARAQSRIREKPEGRLSKFYRITSGLLFFPGHIPVRT
jgi:hypothetical protein